MQYYVAAWSFSVSLLLFSSTPSPLYHYWLGAKLYELNIAVQEVFIEICCFGFSEARSARNKALANRNRTLVSRVTFLSSSTMSFSQTQWYSSIKEPNTLIVYPGVSSQQSLIACHTVPSTEPRRTRGNALQTQRHTLVSLMLDSSWLSYFISCCYNKIPKVEEFKGNLVYLGSKSRGWKVPRHRVGKELRPCPW